MIAFFYGDFIYFFVGGVSVIAGQGLALLYRWRKLLSDAQPHGEHLSGQASRMMRTGMSMLLIPLILLVLFSIVGIIAGKLAVVGSVLIASVITTSLAAFLYTLGSKGK